MDERIKSAEVLLMCTHRFKNKYIRKEIEEGLKKFISDNCKSKEL